MSEPVYRRDEQGRLIEVTQNEQNKAPEARGKAAALSSYLAKKGSPSGKRLDRHVQRFERMWAKADPRIKDKYAARGNSDLAPSEKKALTPPPITNATLNAARPGETTGQAQERFRLSRTKNDPKPTPAPVAAPGSTFAELTKGVPAPEGGVNSVGDGQFEAGQLKGKTPAEQRAMLTADATANPPTAAQKVTQSPMPPADPPISSPAKVAGKPFAGAKPPDINGQIAGVAATVGKGLVAAAGNAARPSDYNSALKPAPTPPINNTPSSGNNSALEKAFPGIQSPDYKAPAPIPAKPLPANSTEATERAFPGVQAQVATARPPATPPPAAAAPMRGSRGRTSEGGTTPPIAAPAAPTGAPIMSEAPKGVNRLTGLPMGYQPGDALPKGADKQTQQRAADSVARQSINQAQATPPIAPPRATIAPATDRYADAQSQYQADKGPADAMDKVYAGASSIDQAKITAQSMKRAGALNRTQTQPPARRSMLAR